MSWHRLCLPIHSCTQVMDLLDCTFLLLFSSFLFLFHSLPNSSFFFCFRPKGKNATDVINEAIDYIQFARSVYVNTCDPSYAVNQITNKFPDYADLPLLSILSAPFRVPGDAVGLGCDCKGQTPQICNITPPPCVF